MWTNGVVSGPALLFESPRSDVLDPPAEALSVKAHLVVLGSLARRSTPFPTPFPRLLLFRSRETGWGETGLYE